MLVLLFLVDDDLVLLASILEELQRQIDTLANFVGQFHPGISRTITSYFNFVLFDRNNKRQVES